VLRDEVDSKPGSLAIQRVRHTDIEKFSKVLPIGSPSKVDISYVHSTGHIMCQRQDGLARLTLLKK